MESVWVALLVALWMCLSQICVQPLFILSCFWPQTVKSSYWGDQLKPFFIDFYYCKGIDSQQTREQGGKTHFSIFQFHTDVTLYHQPCRMSQRGVHAHMHTVLGKITGTVTYNKNAHMRSRTHEQNFLGWMQPSHPRMDVSHAQLSPRVGASAACIPLCVICNLDHRLRWWMWSNNDIKRLIQVWCRSQM